MPAETEIISSDKPSLFKKGQIPWNKGKKYHFKDKRISPKYSEERLVKHRALYKTPEQIKKLSDSHKGIKYSDEYKKNMSKIAKSKNFGQWMFGKKASLETREKMAKSHAGEKSSFWKGGIHNSGYSKMFNKQLKERIRVRDNFICQICGIPELELTHNLHVHHIDYNKHNCNQSNLICLCLRCHSKTQTNREYWMNYFERMSIL